MTLYSSYFISLIAFQKHAKTNVVNLSRVAFEDLKLAKPFISSNAKMVYLTGQSSPALCICFASVYKDHTQKKPENEASVSGGKKTKTLYATMHTQEYELKVANLCILYKVPSFRSQIDKNRWAFSTRPSTEGHTEQTSLSYSCKVLLFFFFFFFIDILLSYIWTFYSKEITFDCCSRQPCQP